MTSEVPHRDDWVYEIVGADAMPVRDQDWGPLRERRFRGASGFEVELGITPLEWLAVPLDPGTARVLRDGCTVVHDPQGGVGAALDSVGVPRRWWGVDDVWSLSDTGAAGEAAQEENSR